MKIISCDFEAIYLLETKTHYDGRGFFMESYNQQTMKDLGFSFNLVQDNHSLSTEEKTLRGLHYQLEPYGQTKIIRVLSGAIFDVVVDIRKNSPTFGKWKSFILSDENKHQLIVSRGFAHGFCTLVPNTQAFYKVDNYYSSKHDRGIFWNDPEINIKWPVLDPILSEKDSKHPMLLEAEINFTYAEKGL